MKVLHYGALFGCVLLAACSGSEKPAPVSPTNLVVNPTVTTDGSGLVTFHASADNATHYVYNYGEGLDEPEESSDGSATHTYVSTGSYEVRVQAVSKDNLEASASVSVDVQVNEPPISPEGYTTPSSYAGMTMVWHDEFNGDHINESDWNFETGPFNDELEYYKQANASEQGGYLIIKAKVEKTDNMIYTSARMTTQNKQSFKYGRVDIRAKVPGGQGMFPALWMLGDSFSTVGWPKCGEIDIMETIAGGGRDSVVYGTAHWDSLGHVQYGGHLGLTNGEVLGDKFHVYSIEWTSTEIRWYLDDVQYHVIDTTPVGLTEFQKPFFFIFNLAVGGGWAGPPNDTTVFPQRMIVDYVRVFQQN